jgi:hypothetical protein
MRVSARAAVGALLALACQSSGAAQPIDSAAAFNRLKTLVGTWEQNGDRGAPVTYTLTGRDSVLLEAAGGMMTAYHLDNGTLVLTHFCGAGNQPRMRVKAITDGGKRIAFEMYDITNHATPDSYYSSALDIVFLSDDRVDLSYRGMQGGNESTQTFHLTRKPPTR